MKLVPTAFVAHFSPAGLIRRKLAYRILLLFTCIWGQGCVTVDVHLSPDAVPASEVRQVMHRYLAAFNVDDFETIGASWHTPGWLSSDESVNSLRDSEGVKGLYRSLLGKIRAEGYDHSELLSEDIKFVNAGCVIYRITFTRWKKDGDFMPPRVRGSVCTLLKVDGKWGLSNVALESGTGKTEALTIQDLMAPDAAVVKLAGDMKFAEGPVWLPKEKKLVFSDIASGKLMEWSETDGLKLFRKSPNPNGNLLDREGRLLTCRHGARDIVRTEKDGKFTILCDSYGGKRLNSPNDLAMKSDGTVWFTDPPWGLPGVREGREQPGNWVFRLDPKTKKVTAVLKEICMPNGIAFSPDERHIYIADTGGNWHPDKSFRDSPAEITAYQVNPDGTLNRKPVWKSKGYCDGMCVDELGNIYTTARAGITVLSPDGESIGMMKTPEPPTNCCFGGDDFKTLFITAPTSLYSVELARSGNRLRKNR